MKETIVLLEHTGTRVKPASLNAITFAVQLDQPFSLLLIGPALSEVEGNDLHEIVEAVRTFGAQQVLVVEDPSLAEPLADKYARVVAQVAKSREASFIVGPSSTFTKDVLPRAAALLDAGMLTDVIAVEKQDGGLLFRRPMYAGNAFGTVRLEGTVRVLSVRPTAFAAPSPQGSQSPVEAVAIETDSLPNNMEFVSREERKSERPDLTEARVVVSGGRPFKDTETFMKYIGGLADALGGAIGASRAAVDGGIAPNDWQVGQTGKVVAPELYIAVGVSGAIQHLAGMKDSKVIIAINKDPDAPIFQIATYSLVGDLYQIVPELIEKIKQLRA